jgi:hypothetical protein
MEVKMQRKHFTRHGQHLNQSGKELVSSELANLIEQHQTKVETTPIPMQWKEGNSESQDGSREPVELLNYDYHAETKNVKDKEEKGIIKMSLRTRKVPVKKSNKCAKN